MRDPGSSPRFSPSPLPVLTAAIAAARPITEDRLCWLRPALPESGRKKPAFQAERAFFPLRRLRGCVIDPNPGSGARRKPGQLFRSRAMETSSSALVLQDRLGRDANPPCPGDADPCWLLAAD